MLSKIASNYLEKKAAQDFGFFDPRVWGQLFGSKRARAQAKWYSEPIKADVVTRADGTQEKNYDREVARKKYYGDSNTRTHYLGNGQFTKVRQIGRPYGSSSDPAEFERQNNQRFIKNIRTNQSYSHGKPVSVQMAQGPDMTKNLPRTGAQRQLTEASANIEKAWNKGLSYIPKAYDSILTGTLRTGEALGKVTGVTPLMRHVSRGQYAETGERFTPWDYMTGKSQTWFQKQKAPKQSSAWGGVNKASELATNYLTAKNTVNTGLTVGSIASGGLLSPIALAAGGTTMATDAFHDAANNRQYGSGNSVSPETQARTIAFNQAPPSAPSSTPAAPQQSTNIANTQNAPGFNTSANNINNQFKQFTNDPFGRKG